MDKGGDSGGIELTRQQCGCVIVTSGPQDARRTAKQPCETHKSGSRRDAPGGWAHDMACESEFVTEAGRWSPCRCGERAKANADGVHAAHCCARHGCKYGVGLCGVTAGRVEQKHPCEFCGEEEQIAPLSRQEREELERLRQNAAILSASTLDEALKLKLVQPYREKIAELEDMVFQLRMEINRLRGLT